MNLKKIKTGLCSYGLSGLAFHAPFIDSHQGFELSSVLERTKNNSKNRYPNVTVVRSFDELIQDSTLELIVINTPTQLHYTMAKEALLSGKHVVLEKPMTVLLAEAEELINIANDKELVLAVYHNRRLESGFKALKSLVDNKTLGESTYFKSHFNRDKSIIGPKAWKEDNTPGAGIFYDLAPHLLDQAFTLFGYPDQVHSKLEKQRPNTQVLDYFLITLNYNTGLKVELEAGMYIKEVDEPKYKLEGTKGVYTKQLEDHQEYLLKQGIYPSNFDPDKGKIVWSDGTSEQVKNLKGSYGDFYNNLYHVINDNATSLITNDQALKVMEVMEEIISKN